MIYFATLLTAVFLLTLNLLHKFSKYIQIDFNNIKYSELPALSDIKMNLMIFLQGGSNGYSRSFWAYAVFFGMAITFVSAGKFILDRVFKSKPSENPEEAGLSALEKISYSYLIGSLVFSLIWFVLGHLGMLNFLTALIVMIGGIILSLKIFSAMDHSSTVRKIKETVRGFSWMEIILVLGIGIFIVILSTACLPSVSYSDTLYAHAAMPNFYIQEGRITVNPYQFYSYFTQNTEMLVMWAFLLKSEAAAVLLTWGYLAALIALIYGFVSRRMSPFTALLTVTLLLSAPITMHSTIMIKPDLPVSVFLFAHFCALMETFDRRGRPEASRWALLAGLLCGAAMGHKLTAITAAAASVLVITADDFIQRRKNRKGTFLAVPLALGIFLAIGPWFLRNTILTGNPVYPFLTGIFRSKIEDPWYNTMEKNFNFNDQGVSGLRHYFSGLLLGNNKEDGPSWGPTFLFILLLFPAFYYSKSRGVRFGIIAIILALLALSVRALDVRYHYGYLALLILIPFAVIGHMAEQKFANRALTISIFSMILFFFISTHLSVHSMGSLTSSVGTFSSGYTLHHFQMQNSDEENLRWMFHLINTRTGETDRILFGRIATVYGVNRRMLFGTSWNRDVFYDLASRCKSPEELRDLLHVMNVRHILMASAFKQNVINSMAPNLPSPETMSMIDQVLERFASLRAVSPDGSMLLYSMKDSLNMDPFVFDERDAEAFPIMYLQSANNETNKGNYSVSLRMLEKFLHIRTRSQNLSYAYGMMIALYALVKNEDKVEELIRNIETLPFQLSYIGYNEVGNVYYHAGRLPLAFEFYAKALKNNPKFYVAFNNLGNIYMANGQNDKAIEYFTDSISLNPTYEIAYYNLYNLYANMGEKEKAQQTLDNLNALKQALR